MNKAIRILLVLIFLLLAFAACAKTEPAPAVQPTASAQQENSLPTAEQSTLSAPEPTTDGPAQPPAAAPVDPQTGAIEGQTLLTERCVTCHAIENVTSETSTYEEWEIIVSRMILKGANLTDEEKAILVQFLADNYKAE